MKKNFTLITFIFLLTGGLLAQNIVSTLPMQKNVILEEFTGIKCVFCPDGHAIAKSIMGNNPGRAFTIAIHQGSFAVPNAGEPDYRTPFGDAIAGQTGVQGYPSGTVNRHKFNGSSKTVLDRNFWASASEQILPQMSPVNIGITSDYLAETRTLTVTVELYYTANASTSSNFINVALIQDSIYGPQTGGNAGSNYLHMHMLRHMITGQWGDEVTTTTQGTLITRTYTYDVANMFTYIPAIVKNMKVVAFVTEGRQEILTGDEVNAIGGTNLYIGEMTSAEPNIKKGIMDSETSFTLSANSQLEGTSSFEFRMEASNAPAGWEATYTIDGIEYTGTAVVELSKNSHKPITIKVIPGSDTGFPKYVIKMKSLANPAAPERQISVSVIAGVTDLVVNGTGGPLTTTHQGAYLNALLASGNTTHAVTNANVMVDLINANAFDDIVTFWMNISWTFPALSDNQAEALKTLMNAGHSVFIGGQDIGWDIMSGNASANGTVITRDFYTNYLKAIFKNDGVPANNQLKVVADDPIYGDVPVSAIKDVFGGSMYPDEIDAGEGARVIFNYNSEAKHAAIMYETENYRSVYFGIGLEMISSVAIRNQIVGLTRAWLADEMVGVEYNAAVNALLNGQNYPNPAKEYTYITVNEAAKGGTIEIYNIKGQLIKSLNIENSLVTRIDVSQLPEGVYVYRVISGGNTSEARKLTVIR